MATLQNVSDEVMQAALAATGYAGWREWCAQSWGTKWNTCNFDGRVIDGMIYDCVFDTAWSCPEPALRALAVKYPALSGTVVASESANDWCLIGAIQDGAYKSSASAYDPQANLLVCGGYQGGPFLGAFAHALIESLACGEAQQLSSDPTVPKRLRTIFAALKPWLPQNLGRRLEFERMTLDVIALLDAGQTARDLRERNLAQHPRSEHDVAFLLSNDRTRTSLDRQLLLAIATDLRDGALAGCRADERSAHDRRALIEDQVLPDYDEDDLRAWASVAMYRPGVLIDMGDAQALARSVLDYSDRLHADLLAHIDGEETELQGAVQMAKPAEHVFGVRWLPPHEGVQPKGSEVGPSRP